jgi:hypothetical protein
MPYIQFSLTTEQIRLLQNFAQSSESAHLVAKRLVLSYLNNLETLPTNQSNPFDSPPDAILAVKKLENQVKLLEARISEIETNDYLDRSEFEERITDVDNRIEKLENEVEIHSTLSKSAVTNSHGEFVIFLADQEKKPISFWSGQAWVNDLDLAYQYKSRSTLSRIMDKLKKRKLPGVGMYIDCASMEKLLEVAKP